MNIKKGHFVYFDDRVHQTFWKKSIKFLRSKDMFLYSQTIVSKGKCKRMLPALINWLLSPNTSLL